MCHIYLWLSLIYKKSSHLQHDFASMCLLGRTEMGFVPPDKRGCMRYDLCRILILRILYFTCLPYVVTLTKGRKEGRTDGRTEGRTDGRKETGRQKGRKAESKRKILTYQYFILHIIYLPFTSLQFPPRPTHL